MTMHILIADDDPVYRTFIEELVSKWGFTVSLACDGKEALEALDATPKPDAVLLDWMMPEIDGFEVCRRIKQSEHKDTYVIMITGISKKNDLIKVLVAGADDYIGKPFEPIDLQIHLRNAVAMLTLRTELAELQKQTV